MQQYLLHTSPQYGELQPTSGWDRFVSLGTPANFNSFRVLAYLLQWRRSTEANHILHSVWPLPGLVDYKYIFGGCCSVTEFFQVQNSLCVLQVLQSSCGRQPNFAALSTVRRLYSAGRPSHWALAHILVCSCVVCFCRVRFSFFITVPRDWLGRTSQKWPILCQVGRETPTQSISQSISAVCHV